MREDVLLDLVDEAEWRLRVTVDEDGELSVEIDALTFGGSITHFIAPGQPDDDGVERATWWVTQDREDADGEVIEHYERAVTVAEAIDKVPHAFERWVLSVTRNHVEYLAGAAEYVPDDHHPAAETAAANALRAELDQADAHE